MVTETKALANSLDAPSGTEREEIIPIIPDKWETRQGMKCTRARRKLLSPKSRLRIGTWNVRTMYEQGRCAQVVKEMKRYNLSILGVSEMRWNTFGSLRTATGEFILYSGNPNEDDQHVKGVGLILSRSAADSLLAWEPVSERVITARFASKCQNMSIIQVYAPTNDATEEEKESFYYQLQTVYDRTPRRDVIVVIGNFNAKIGNNNTGMETVMGQHGLGSMNENGEILADFCTCNDIVIGGTIFPHKPCHKATWRSPDARTENQIDHITINRRWKSALQDVRVRRGADVDSDHHLVVAQFKLKLAATKKKKNLRRRYDIRNLKFEDKRREFQLTLQNRFELLDPSLGEDGRDVNEDWYDIRDAYIETCEEVLGKVERNRKEWITDDTWRKIEERRQLKVDVDKARTRLEKRNAMQQYRIKGRQVKEACRRDKRAYINQVAADAEEAASKGDLNRLYQTTRILRILNS